MLATLNRLSSVIVFTLFFVLITTNAESVNSGSNSNNALDTYLQKFVDEHNIIGLQVAVFDQSNTLFEESYGHANPHKKVSLKTNTLMFSASLSKLITSEIVTDMLARKQLMINQQISDFFPQLAQLSAQLGQVTIEQLLTHTSGLSDDSFDFPSLRFGKKTQKVSEYINSAKKVEFEAPPGQQYTYSDINFQLLGAIIESVKEKPFAEVVTESVFTPLGMRYSGYDRDALSGYFFSPSYKKRNRLPGKSEKEVYPQIKDQPSNGLFSSLYDLVIWSKYQLKHSLQYTAWQAHHPIDEQTDMGLGWRMTQLNGTKVVFHYGGYRGFRHMLGLIPESKIGIVILSNDSAMDQYRQLLFKDIAELSL